MKPIFVTAAVLTQMLFVFSAEAEELSKVKKIPKREVVKNDRLHFLATLPVYIFTVGSVIHEGSHAAAVGAWRLWVNGKRVFLDADSPREIDGSVEFTIAPLAMPEGFGVLAEVRF